MSLMMTINVKVKRTGNKLICSQLRWDKADSQSYYLYTGVGLDPILKGLNRVTELFCSGDKVDISSVIDNTYTDIVNVLNTAASRYVLTCENFRGTVLVAILESFRYTGKCKL